MGPDRLEARVIAALRPIEGNLHELGVGNLAAFFDAPPDFNFRVHKALALKRNVIQNKRGRNGPLR
jgi:hypothetical protein